MIIEFVIMLLIIKIQTYEKDIIYNSIYGPQ